MAELTPSQQAALNTLLDFAKGKLDTTLAVLSGWAGTGKALAFDQVVQTPDGPRPIGALVPGDMVFGWNGNAVRITGVYPQGERQAYRVTFRDGQSVECDIEHLWAVQTAKMRQLNSQPRIMTLREILKSGLAFARGTHKFSIPLCAPVKYREREQSVHPYLLGLLIGDGTSLGDQPALCIPDMDFSLVAEATKLLPDGMSVSVDRAPSCPRYRFVDMMRRGNRLSALMRDLHLDVTSPNRFIPEMYLRGSIAQRWALLRGLMDTDGSCRNNRTTFSTMSEKLVSGIIELVQSLGGIAIAAQQKRGEWQVNIKTHECPFSLARKSAHWSFSRKNPPSRFIVKVEPSRVCDHVCIKVDAQDGLFLTEGFVVTHNTFLVAQILTMLPDHLAIAVAAPTNKAVRVLREKLAEAGVLMDDDPVEPGTDRQDAETIAFGSVHSFLGLQLSERDDGTQECRASRDPTLHRYNLVVVDECSMIGEDLFRQLVLSKRQARILFVGDPAQLPPIQSSDAISPAFSQVQLQVRLNEIVRQAEDNPIIALSVKIRQAMEVGNRIDAITIASVLPPLPAKAALVAGDSRTIAEFALWELREGRDARVVAFTNANVQMFNRYIHDALHGLTEFAFVPGEKVIIHQQTSGYYLDDDGNMSVGSTTLITSEEAEIVSLERKDHPLYPTVPSLWVRLKREDSSLVGVFLAISQDDVERAVTQGFAEWRRLKSMSNAAELLGQHKEAQSLLYDSKKASSQAWSLRRFFAPLRHAYALTAHKSQGSTFDSAIVDLNDLSKMKSSFQFNRALYVAATRAREHLAIVA